MIKEKFTFWQSNYKSMNYDQLTNELVRLQKLTMSEEVSERMNYIYKEMSIKHG